MPAPYSVKRILLIDDDTDDFLVFEDALKEINSLFELSYIRSAKDIPKDGECKIPELIFLDINMPDKDGFEWLKDIRNSGYKIPVIMYSTADNPVFVKRAYDQGANIYFPKPESFRKLQTSLKELLGYDWQQPEKVTEQFCKAGEYKVFGCS